MHTSYYLQKKKRRIKTAILNIKISFTPMKKCAVVMRDLALLSKSKVESPQPCPLMKKSCQRKKGDSGDVEYCSDGQGARLVKSQSWKFTNKRSPFPMYNLNLNVEHSYLTAHGVVQQNLEHSSKGFTEHSSLMGNN